MPVTLTRLVCAFAVLLAGPANLAIAQAFPARPVRMIIPFPPGGNTDYVGRAYATRLSERWGQQVVVDNRGGANTIVGAEAAARALPDGHTLFLTTATTMTTNPLVYRKLPYDPVKSFALVSGLAYHMYVIATHAGAPFGSVQELVAQAKARPGQITFGSSGTGSSGHLGGAMLEAMAGIRLTHVPYKGGGPLMIDMLAGQIGFMLSGIGPVQQHVKQGKVKLVAVTGAKRLAGWTDVPTVAEAGYPGYEALTWFGIVVPAGTPRPLVERLSADIRAVGRGQAVVDQMVAHGYEAFTHTPEAFARFVAAEAVRVGAAVKASGFRID